MRKRWFWLIVIMVLLAAGSGYIYYRFFMSPARAEEGPAFETAQVYQGDIIVSVDGTGNLMPAAEIEVGFQTGGLLAALEVEIGDTVQAGDVLARLDTHDLEVEVENARLQLEQARINLEKLQVSPGEAEVTTARNSLAQARANLAEQQVALAAATERARLSWITAANNLRDAQANYSAIYWDNRQLEQRLAGIGQTLPQDNIDAEAEAWRAVENAEAAMEQARLSYESTRQQEQTSLLTAQLQVSTAQANLDELYAGASATDLAAAQISLEQAQIGYEQAQIQLERAVLRAPMAGTVMAINATVGEQVGTSALVTLANLQSPLLRFWVEESDLSGIAVGHKVNVVFEAFPDLTFSGQVFRIEPALVSVDNTSAVQAWATIDLSSTQPIQLLSGMTAEVEVIAAEARNVLLVPLEALRDLGNGQYAVFVVGAGGELELRPVEVGLQDEVNAEIRSGLRAGETVSLGERESAAGQSTEQEVPRGGFFPGMGPMIER